MRIPIRKTTLIAALVVVAAAPALGQTAPTTTYPAMTNYLNRKHVALTTGSAISQYASWPYPSTLARSSQLKDPTPPVVLVFSESQPGRIEMMEEDLAVMTRIIERALESGLGQAEAAVKMGVRLLLTDVGRTVRAMYVEGVGPLFLMKVNFPLVAPPKSGAKEPEAKASSVWEKTLKELRGNVGDEPSGGAGDSTSEYDAEKVETLKKILLSALKEAANIRHLDADESIAISVFGDGGGTGLVRGRLSSEANRRLTEANRLAAGSGTENTVLNTPRRQVNMFVRDGQVMEIDETGRILSVTPTVAKPSGAGQGTVLTIRVKKADVDAFEKGELKFEDFVARAAVHAYSGAGLGSAGLTP